MLALAVLAAGCGEPTRVFDSEELACDVAERSCQQAIWRSVAGFVEADDVEIPPVRVISVEEHEEELLASYEPDTVEVSANTVAFRLVGFIPDDDTTIVDNYIEDSVSNTWAYYSTTAESVTIIDRDYEPSQVNAVLAHEFAHSIQDQQFDLSAFMEGFETEDQYMAGRSVVEGDAMRLEWDWYFWVEGAPLTPEEWQGVLADRKSALREWARAPDTRFIQAVVSFPYVYGMEFMAEAYVVDGLPTRRAIFESPPRTTASIVKGYPAFSRSAARPEWPSIVSHPAPVSGYDVFAMGPLGMWYVYVFLGRLGMSESDAWNAAIDLRSDSLGIYESPSDVAVVWRLSFTDAAHVGTVERAVAEASAPREWQPMVYDNDVFIIATETQEALARWASQPLDSNTAIASKSTSSRRLAPIALGARLQPR